MTSGDGGIASGLRVLADAVGADAARLSRIEGGRCHVVATTGEGRATAAPLTDTIESLVCAREAGMCVDDLRSGAYAEHPAAAGPWRSFVAAPAGGGEFVVVAMAHEPRRWDDSAVGVVRVAGALIARRARLGSGGDSDALFHMIAHDVAGPARTVRSLGEALRDSSASELSERDRIKLGAMIGAAAKIERTVAGLTRLRSVGRGEVAARVDLGELVGGVIARRGDALAQVGASVAVDDLGAHQVRREALSAAISDLVDNAIAYRNPHRPLSIRVERLAGETVGLCVIDNGVGVDAPFRGRVAEPLRTLHTKGREPGAGIGLAVAAKVAEMHGGELWLDDGDDGGLAVNMALAPRH